MAKHSEKPTIDLNQYMVAQSTNKSETVRPRTGAKPTVTVILKLPPELREQLDALKAQTGKSLNEMGIEALEEYVKKEMRRK